MLEGHADEVVRDNAKTIVCVALAKGSLKFADRLAAGAANAYEKMKMRLGKGTSNVKTLFSDMLVARTLDVDRFLEKAA